MALLSKQQALNEFSPESTQCAATFAVSSHRFVSVGQLKEVSIEKTRNFLHQLQYSTGKAAGMSDKAKEAPFCTGA